MLEPGQLLVALCVVQLAAAWHIDPLMAVDGSGDHRQHGGDRDSDSDDDVDDSGAWMRILLRDIHDDASSTSSSYNINKAYGRCRWLWSDGSTPRVLTVLYGIA